MARTKTNNTTFTLADVVQAVAEAGVVLEKESTASGESAFDRLDHMYEESVASDIDYTKEEDDSEDGDEDDESLAAVNTKLLPMAPIGTEWSASAADKRVRTWAKSEKAPNAKYRRAFLWYDSAKPDAFGSYKLQVGDIIDGKLVAVFHAISACRSVVNGGRGGIDIPEADKQKVKTVLAAYSKKQFTKKGQASNTIDDVSVIASVETVPSNDRFANERKTLKIDEEHPNLFFVDVLLTHANKVMNNENHDMISMDEMVKAQSSLMLQPMDASPLFDRHMRERFWDSNGIRGVIYASSVEGDALWVGCAIWARDFPDIAESILRDGPILGSSFDLCFASNDVIAGSHRALKDIKFLGGTLLYKTRAADSDTQIGDMNFMGTDLNDPNTSGGSKPMEKETTAAEFANVITEAATTASNQMAKITELEGKIAELIATNDTLAAQHKESQEKLAEATSKLDTIEMERVVAERRSARLTELNGLDVFASEEDAASAAEELGTMDDATYAAYKTSAQITSLTNKLHVANEQLTQKNSVAEIAHNDEPGNQKTDTNGGEDTALHNGTEVDDAIAQAGSLSGVNATTTTSDNAAEKTPRSTGRKIANLFNSKE